MTRGQDWKGEERRQVPNPQALQEELKAVRHDVGRLASSVATLGSDERMQKVVDSVVEEEMRHRQALLIKIVVGLLVLAFIGIFNLTMTNRVKDIATDAKVVASYVDHCLVHPSKATPGECGNVSATGAPSVTLLSIFCVLQIPIEGRSDEVIQDCSKKAAEKAKSLSTTTSTSITTTTR